MKRSRRLYAFSLIELLVVIGLIAILGSLLLMGINHLIINSKRQQTRLTFQNLQAMYSEWDAVNHRHFPCYLDPLPAGAVTVNPPVVTVPAPMNVTLAGNPNPPTKSAPGDDTTPDNRYGQAVWETRDVMQMLINMPANATAVGKMSASALMTFPANLVNPASNNYTVIIPNPYNATIQPFNNTTSYSPVTYASNPGTVNSFAIITMPNPLNANTPIQIVFRCIKANPALPTSVSPPDLGYWMPVAAPVDTSNGWQSSALTVPVALDAWGNPIIFVPGGELGSGVALSSGGSTPAGYPTPGSGAIATSPGASGRSITVTSPDGRPFWASAGPDGDFSLGDDNLYSFER